MANSIEEFRVQEMEQALQLSKDLSYKGTYLWINSILSLNKINKIEINIEAIKYGTVFLKFYGCFGIMVFKMPQLQINFVC